MSDTKNAEAIRILKNVIEGVDRLLSEAIALLENVPHQEQVTKTPEPSKPPKGLGETLQKAGLSPSMIEVRESGDLYLTKIWYDQDENERSKEQWEEYNKELWRLGFKYVRSTGQVAGHWTRRE